MRSHALCTIYRIEYHSTDLFFVNWVKERRMSFYWPVSISSYDQNVNSPTTELNAVNENKYTSFLTVSLWNFARHKWIESLSSENALRHPYLQFLIVLTLFWRSSCIVLWDWFIVDTNSIKIVILDKHKRSWFAGNQRKKHLLTEIGLVSVLHWSARKRFSLSSSFQRSFSSPT